MLKLLRKYQKGIFAVVAFMVIASFSFFGTYGAIRPERHEEENKVVGKAVDGSSLFSLEIGELTRFLDTDFKDLMSGSGANAVNALNDGFIRKDIFEGGLGSLIFEAYQDDLQGEISKKVAKFKEFKPYVHPSQIMGFESMIKQFAPVYYEDWVSFRGEKGGFNELVRLYLDQDLFPGEMVRRMMLYGEYQNSGLGISDPHLRDRDFSLFYAKSVSDWFGKEFLEKVAVLVCQGAAFAKQHGYKVNFEEAKSSLMQIATKHLKELDPNKVITNEDVGRFYKQQIAMLQMSEKEVIKTWQKVLVFRKMLNEVGRSVFVDSLLYKQFSEFASKGAKVELYQLPPAVRLKSVEEGKKLEGYLEIVSKKRDVAVLPEEFLSVDDIKSRAPELVEKRFLVKIANCKKDVLASEIGVRKTWDWQLEDRHWNSLKGAFSEIAKCKSSDPEGRFLYLEGLDKGIREKVDQFSRRKILEEDPGFIKERLANSDFRTRVLSITLSGEGEILPGITDRKGVLELLEEGSERLSCYTENGEDFYRIQVMDKSSIWEVLTFDEANQRGMLNHLQKEMVEVDVTRRLVPFMKKMQQAIVAGKEGVLEESVVRNQEALQPKISLAKQWGLQREEIEVTRKMGHPILSDKLFSMEKGQWSDVICTETGPVFYRVLETFVDTSEVGKKMEEGRALLGTEAKQHFMKTFLQEIRASGS